MNIPFPLLDGLLRRVGLLGLVGLVATTTVAASTGSGRDAPTSDHGVVRVALVAQSEARPAADPQRTPTARPSAASPGPPEMGPGRGLKAADADGDGKISRAEFMQHHQAMFERLPKDADGKVSIEDAIRYGGMHGGEMPPGSRPAGPLAPRPGARGPMSPGGMAPGTTRPGGDTAPASRPPEAPETQPGPSGSPAPDGEPERGREPATDAASSSSSAASSNPSSTAPQESKPGR